MSRSNDTAMRAAHLMDVCETILTESVPKTRECGRCEGTGRVPIYPDTDQCPRCKGTGRQSDTRMTPMNHRELDGLDSDHYTRPW